jgi:starvation-inducible DNA-binding protein
MLSDVGADATRDIPAALRALLADAFALYLNTKNVHWHMSGPLFRDYHLLLDGQGDQIFAMTDDVAERARKIGRLQRLLDNDADYVTADDMLRDVNKQFTKYLRGTHALCDEYDDVATASLIENRIDEAERAPDSCLKTRDDHEASGHT